MTREEAILNIKVLKEDYWDDDGYGHESEAYEDTMSALDMAIKALEQEPKTGQWIVDEYGIKHCPFCNAINNSVYDSYCPNCGCRMKGEIE